MKITFEKGMGKGLTFQPKIPHKFPTNDCRQLPSRLHGQHAP